MHRPKKKKNSDPLLPEDNVVDERHLIDMEDSVELSIEDRISMYWMENKGFIVGCISALAVVLIVINGLRIYQGVAIENLQAEFAQADANDDLQTFADENPGKDLGGFAALTTADAAYEAGEYEKALEYYSKADKALENTVLAGRAKIGEAFALYQTGATTEGIAQLAALANNTEIAASTRGEAIYHLALEAKLNGDTDAYEGYSAQLSELSLAGPWQQRLAMQNR